MKIKRDCIYYVRKFADIPDFLKTAEKEGILWCTGESPIEYIYTPLYGSATAFWVDEKGFMTYALLSFYKGKEEFCHKEYKEWNPDNSTLESSTPIIIQLNEVKIIFKGDYTFVTDGVRTGWSNKHEDNNHNDIELLRIAVERFEAEKTSLKASSNVINSGEDIKVY